MKFCDIETSRKLVELGCRSESGQSWFELQEFGPFNDKQSEFNKRFYLCEASKIRGKQVPAFTILDFLGDTEVALENCRLMFGENEKMKDGKYQLACDHERHALLNSTDQIKYISDAVREVKND